MKDELPLGWVSVELQYHVYIAGRIGWRGLKRSEYTNSGPRFLAVKNILPTGEVDFSNTDHISQERYDESPEIQLHSGDILLTKDGTIGKVAMVNKLSEQTTVNSSLLVVRPKTELLRGRYLFHFLRGPKFQAIARERITGSAIPHLFQKDIKKLKALVPPLPEQLRIVAKLEKLLDKVDSCQMRLAKISILLKRFRQAVLAAACSGRLTADWREYNETDGEPDETGEAPEKFPLLPRTWRWRPLQSVCDHVVDCPHSTPKWTANGRICVRTTNFRPGHLDLSEVRYVSEQTFKERIERLLPKPGDILYSREGGILGIACVIPQGADMCLGQRMMLFRVKGDFRNELLMHWLNSSPILSRVRELTGGSASPHLNVRDIKAFPTPIPPVAEQELIVRRVHDLFCLADQVEYRYAKAKHYVDNLKQSILAKAFRGELVPQDPNDEPSSVLLERIREARSTESPKRLVKRTSKSGVQSVS